MNFEMWSLKNHWGSTSYRPDALAVAEQHQSTEKLSRVWIN